VAVKKTGLSSFPTGTVLLSSRAPIGKVAIAGCEMYCNQGFKNLICSDAINNKYLYWLLKSKTEFLNSLGRGANLVFYKQFFSVSKFWQMFGRGTRLCEDLFGPGDDKKEFYIFDYMANFQFFKENPQGKESSSDGSLAEKAFSLKVHTIQALQAMEYQAEELIPFRKALVDVLSSSVAALNVEQFQVRQNLEYVEKYSKPEDKLTPHQRKSQPPK